MTMLQGLNRYYERIEDRKDGRSGPPRLFQHAMSRGRSTPHWRRGHLAWLQARPGRSIRLQHAVGRCSAAEAMKAAALVVALMTPDSVVPPGSGIRLVDLATSPAPDCWQ
jgi:hypothetical protein